jgi:hypothetical protein
MDWLCVLQVNTPSLTRILAGRSAATAVMAAGAHSQ